MTYLWDKQMGTVFISGKPIPESGIYRVQHEEHRLPSEVTLIKGEKFPACSVCANEVRFELVQAVPVLSSDSSFRTPMYVLPVITEDKK